MYRPNRGGLEIVSGGCGIRQAGERRSVVGKDPEACGIALGKRQSGGSDLWSIPQCGFRRRAIGSH
ncbi:MAG: hypothetical protein J4G14_15175 [Dehalococcoidia bacterium]|nr:hypothetical protein [Dehalococcoidia bacterium]